MLLNHLHDNTQHLNHLHVNTPAPLLYESCMGHAEGPRRSNAAARECNGAGEQRDSRALLSGSRQHSLLQAPHVERHCPSAHSIQALVGRLLNEELGGELGLTLVKLVCTNFVFEQHVLDNIFKHLHSFMHVNRMGPVLFCPSCNRSTVEFRRPRISLYRINFTRPKLEHSPVKS